MSDIEKWCKKDGVYRFDYIGQKIYEGKYFSGFRDNTGSYLEVLKTGCVYAIPHDVKIEPNHMISNCRTRYGTQLRIRKFDGFYAIEPSGIIVLDSNVTFVSSEQKELYDKVCDYISPNNCYEAIHVSFNTFYGRYCQNITHESKVSPFEYDKINSLVCGTLARGENKKEFTDACLFCYFLLNNGVDKIDINVLKKYIHSLKNSLLDNSNYYKKCGEFLKQFITLMYFGVVYSDYENIYKELPRSILDSYDPNTDEINSHVEEKLGNQFNDLIIDDSEVVKKYLTDIYEKNKDNGQMMEYLANAYASFYNRLVKETGENIIKK
jgi:hypothetical protein